MKQTKRIGAVLLLGAMLLLAAMPAVQAAVINPETPGFIAIYKYASDDAAQDETPATGTQQDISGFEPIPRIEFRVTRVADDTADAQSAQVLEGAQEYSKTETTDENGLARFDGLAHGVYLVQETPNAAVTAPVDDFLVQIPMTNPAGNGFLYGVYVYPKNQLAAKPGIRMYIGAADTQYISAARGETVPWHIYAGIPRDIAAAEAYAVESEFNSSLTYEADSTLVYTQDSDGAQSALPDGQYSVSQTGNTLTVSLTAEGRETLAQVRAEDAAAELYVTFRTVLASGDEAFPEILGVPLYGTAQLRYTNGLGIDNVSELPTGTEPYVYLGGLVIQKTDGRTGDPLGGASFRIYSTRQDADNEENALTAPGGGVWEETTDEYGFASFYGLPYGEEDAGAQTGTSTYYLVETQAPEGYNLLGAPVAVTVSYESHEAGKETRIDNNKGFTLPLTGGAGTLLFTVIGLLLVAAAAYMLVRARKNAR